MSLQKELHLLRADARKKKNNETFELLFKIIPEHLRKAVVLEDTLTKDIIEVRISIEFKHGNMAEQDFIIIFNNAASQLGISNSIINPTIKYDGDDGEYILKFKYQFDKNIVL